MKILSLLENHDIQTNAFIMLLGICLLYLLDIKIIVILIVCILLVVNYIPLITAGDTTERSKKDIKKQDVGDDMYYNNKIHDLLIQLKKYKKYNKVSYKDGVKYMRKFFKTVHILEHDDIYNYNHYFENAQLYLRTSLNHFQSMTISLPERTLIDGIKYGDFEASKKMNKLGKLCKELYNECYYVLLNLSVEFNKTWTSSPNIYNKEIDMNTDRTESYNENDEVHWALH